MDIRNIMNIRHLRYLMSRAFSVKNESKQKTTDWMLQDFPDSLKQRCKEKALSERKTLKAFVIEVLEKAVGGNRPKTA